MNGERILITTDAVGGVWRYALDLGRGLNGAGTEVVLAGLGPRPSLEAEREAAGTGKLEWGEAPLDWMATGPGELAGVGRWIGDIAERHDVTHLHLNLPSQAADLPDSMAGLPVVVVSHSCLATWIATVRNSAVPCAYRWHRDLTARGLARADAIVAPSRSHAMAVRRSYAIAGPVEVVPNSVAPYLTGEPRRENFVAVGRWWDSGKNAAVLDGVAMDLRWPVMMIGPSEGPDGTNARITQAHALGSLPYDVTRRYLASAGVFVSPSLYEPFGLAVLEAALGATPLVLSDIPTFREYWDEAALFFPPEDQNALLIQLTRLVRSPDLRARLGQAALERAGTFSPKRQVTAMREIYRRTLCRKTAPQAAE